MSDKYLTAGEILAARSQLRTAEVDAPGLGLVRVRQMSLRDRSRLAKAKDGGASDGEMAALIMCLCAINEEGVRLFGDEERDLLMELDAVPVDAVARAVLALSSITQQVVEEAEKNSEAAPSGGSSSV